MDTIPIKLERKSDALLIEWDDAFSQRISVQQLRQACPCAHCVDKHSWSNEKTGPSDASRPDASGNPLRVLKAEETRPLSIVAMRPVGNYAYNIQFSDGHGTGIYTLAQLRNLTG